MQKRLLKSFSPRHLLNMAFAQGERQFLEKRIILWYPSSGQDISDILYVNQIFLPQCATEPDIFIHTDQMQYDDLLSSYPCFYQVNKVQTEYNDFGCNFYSFNHFGKEKYLLQILGIDNTDFLAGFIQSDSKLHVKFLYTFCDGITSGMGAGEERSISTLFYTRFYGLLKVSYHLTEYSKTNYQEDNPRWDMNSYQEVINLFFEENPHLRRRQDLIEDYPECILSRREIRVETFRHYVAKNVFLRFCE